MRPRRRGAAAIAAVLAALVSAGCTQVTDGRLASAPPDPSPPARPRTSVADSVPSGLQVSGALPARLVSAVDGRLPRNGTLRMYGMTLVGRRVGADTDNDGRPDGPALLWVTDRVLDDAGTAWRIFARHYASTGLYPVVLQAEETDPDNGNPWLTGQFDRADAHDPSRLGTPAHVLSTLYAEQVKAEDPGGADLPFGVKFPGLAARSAKGLGFDDGGQAADSAANGLPGRIGLVAVHRPADVPYAIGWLGASNEVDAGYVTEVLRSWEDRFGVQIVRMGVDYVEVSVRYPPVDIADAKRVAAEHFALCPDQILESDFDSYAGSLINNTTWYCEWY